MALKSKLQGRENSYSTTQRSCKQTFYGTEAEVDTYMGSLTIGAKYGSKGFLTTITKRQENAAVWEVQVQYTVNFGDSSYSNTASTVVGRKSATLTARCISMPLQTHENYLTNWNHYLCQKVDPDDPDPLTPDWWQTETTTVIPAGDAADYRWIENLSQLPTEADDEGKIWQIIEDPQKPGVDHYDFSMFVVTQLAKYGSASAAGAAIEKNINHICSPAQTFGISGGDWKCDESSVSYDGKNWIASSTYTHSPDGWDTELYS